jgi:hypothetical protein
VDDDDRTAAPGRTDPEATAVSSATPDTVAIGAERLELLLAVGDVASLAFQVAQEAAQSARHDLETVMHSIRALNEHQRAGRAAVEALDDAAGRAAAHLHAVDELTEAASRTLGEALDDSGELASEAALEQLDAWADASRLQSQRLHHDLHDGWGVGEALDSLAELGQAEAVRLQMLMDRRAKLMQALSTILKAQADTARSITDNLK